MRQKRTHPQDLCASAHLKMSFYEVHIQLDNDRCEGGLEKKCSKRSFDMICNKEFHNRESRSTSIIHQTAYI